MKWEPKKFYMYTHMTYEDLSKLSAKEIKEVASYLSHYSNNRLNKINKFMEQNDMDTSPLLREKSIKYYNADHFSVKRYRNQNLANIRIMQQFLRGKTSTVKGIKNMIDDFVNRVGATIDIPNQNIPTSTKEFLTSKEYSNFWRLYRELSDSYEFQKALSRLPSEVLQRDVFQRYVKGRNKGQDVETILRKNKEKLETKLYLERLKYEEQDIDILIADKAKRDALKNNKAKKKRNGYTTNNKL